METLLFLLTPSFLDIAPELVDAQDEGGLSSLHWAVQNASLEAVRVCTYGGR